MRALSFVIFSLLAFGFHPSAASSPDRGWQTALVQQIQRVPNTPNNGDHWEYVLVSGAFTYTLRTATHDAPYLNSSLGSEVKIASAISGSNRPYDGDEVYVIDAKGQEHKIALVNVVVQVSGAGCKK